MMSNADSLVPQPLGDVKKYFIGFAVISPGTCHISSAFGSVKA
jgi:hypothetical protein